MTQLHDEPAGTVGRAPDGARGRGPAWLENFLARELPDLIALRRRLHAHPELSRREHATTALLVDALGRAGVDTIELPCGTGLVADVGFPEGESGPRIVLRADLDALPVHEETDLPFASTVPGVAHACGHDVHTAVVLGAALALVSAPQLRARVRAVFQPAEEVFPGGAWDVVNAGLLTDVDLAYALHCDPSLQVGFVGTRVGPITSSCDTIEITVTGPGGHTSRPHLTVDLVGALGRLAVDLPQQVARHLPTQAGVTFAWGAIDAGGPDAAANVIPRCGRLRGTLRLADRAAWSTAEILVRRLVHDVLAPFDAAYEIEFVRGVPPSINAETAVVHARVGVKAALGEAKLVESPQSAGGEDFAVMLDEVPGALLRLGVWDGQSEQVDLHTPAFRVDEGAIAVGIRTLVHTVLAAQR